MTLETWLTYTLAYILLSLTPGPSVFMVLGQSLSNGMRAALYCIFGDLFGGVFVMTTSYIGLGLILETSSEAYQIIKWGGVAYMAWLGLTQINLAWKMSAADLFSTANAVPRITSLRVGFTTGVLNPKAILFYLSFLAQFMNPLAPLTPQFLILMATSTIVVFLVLFGYAMLAAQAQKTMHSLKARKRMGYLGGTALLTGSALLATNK